MKTREEMVYDFMISMSSNGGFFNEWTGDVTLRNMGPFCFHVKKVAELLADEYLRSLG
tara:strand:- start:123 stop:296 length:174 start_codon:yes stop_codon:yes gene_type:complete